MLPEPTLVLLFEEIAAVNPVELLKVLLLMQSFAELRSITRPWVPGPLIVTPLTVKLGTPR